MAATLSVSRPSRKPLLPASTTSILLPHPANPDGGSEAIEVRTSRSAAGLSLTYRIIGKPSAIRLPPPGQPGPADGLWRHTCCEAFIVGDSAYHEFNFSPAGNWAVYRFTDIRQRDTAYRPPCPPTVDVRIAANQVTLTADIPATLLPAGRARTLGLTAVIERADGALGYWALRHDAPQADFHRPATFLIPLDSA